MPDDIGIRQADDLPGIADAARIWHRAGFSIVPIKPGGTKRPLREWSTLQSTFLAQSDLDYYWPPLSDIGIAVICGTISGNLEMTELEAGATGYEALERIAAECTERGVGELWGQLRTEGYAEITPSRGLHLLYRISDHIVPGNTKLAATPQSKTLAETRGEGGYVIVAPTGGNCHPTGQPWRTVAGRIGVVPTITWEQREALHAAITAALDESPPAPPPTPRREIVVRTTGELTPGDDFNLRASWEDSWFTDQGWQVHSRLGHETFWTRPNKDRGEGHSASTGYRDGRDCLYIWSTSTSLESETPHSKFYVYAHYFHNGDLSAAAKDLYNQNYGSRYEHTVPALANWDGVDEHHPGALIKQLSLEEFNSRYERTDIGNSQLMFDLHGQKFLYGTGKKVWYFWTGAIWDRDKTKRIDRAAVDTTDYIKEKALEASRQTASADEEEVKTAKEFLRFANASRSNRKINDLIARFAGMDQVSFDIDEFDSNCNLLNVGNGTLDLETGTLLPHNPNHYLTKTMAAEYSKDAQCPQFLKFIEDAFPDQALASYIQRAMGYSLLGRASERALFILHGPSGTGKSVLTNTITAVMGQYGDVAPASTFRLKRNDSSTLDQNSLRGKRFITTSELPKGADLDEELIKRLTGGDKVNSRGLYEAFDSWKPQCTIWIATNHLPNLSQDDNALWRRIKIIPMHTEFATKTVEQPAYHQVLIKEADGILNWLLDGLADYRNRGLEEEPEVITKAVENYRLEVDTVAAFIKDLVEDDILILDAANSISHRELFKQYCEYCQEQLHCRPVNDRRFLLRLGSLGYEWTSGTGGKTIAGIGRNPQVGARGTVGPLSSPAQAWSQPGVFKS